MIKVSETIMGIMIFLDLILRIIYIIHQPFIYLTVKKLFRKKF